MVVVQMGDKLVHLCSIYLPMTVHFRDIIIIICIFFPEAQLFHSTQSRHWLAEEQIFTEITSHRRFPTCYTY